MTDTAKTVIITGASRGIGETTARYLAAEGHQVVLCARGADAVQGIAAEIGSNARALACDVANHDQVKAAVDFAVQEFGSLDVLVNNAGLLEPVERLTDFDPADWDRVIDVNVKGVFYGMHAAIPVMLKKGGGTIINISSGAAYNVLEGWSHYCASKAAVLQLTRAGQKEYGDQGIRSIGLSPGTVATEMQRTIKASGMNPVSTLNWEDHIAPLDVARTIAHLMGPGGDGYLGQDFSLKTPEARVEVGLGPKGG